MADDAAIKYDCSDHPLYNTSNCKALRFFKDDLNSVPMKEFVGLRPKCYAFLCTGEVDKNVIQHDRPVEKKTAKGVKRKVKDEHLHFTQYIASRRLSVSRIFNCTQRTYCTSKESRTNSV